MLIPFSSLLVAFPVWLPTLPFLLVVFLPCFPLEVNSHLSWVFSSSSLSSLSWLPLLLSFLAGCGCLKLQIGNMRVRASFPFSVNSVFNHWPGLLTPAHPAKMVVGGLRQSLPLTKKGISLLSLASITPPLFLLHFIPIIWFLCCFSLTAERTMRLIKSGSYLPSWPFIYVCCLCNISTSFQFSPSQLSVRCLCHSCPHGLWYTVYTL